MKSDFITEKYIAFRAINKDPEAFAQAYDLYVDQIYRFIFFKIPTAEEAQDLTSETFLKTWQYIIDGNKVENLRALLYRIARNLIIDYYRKSRNEVSIDEETPLLKEQDAVVVDSVSDDVDLTIAKELVQKKLYDLKDEYREVIILRHIEELSIKEIAEIIEKKPGAVRVTLYRAVHTLKTLIDADQSSSEDSK